MSNRRYATANKDTQSPPAMIAIETTVRLVKPKDCYQALRIYVGGCVSAVADFRLAILSLPLFVQSAVGHKKKVMQPISRRQVSHTTGGPTLMSNTYKPSIPAVT